MNVENIRKDMIAAMKAGNKQEKEVLSSLINTINNMAIDRKCKDNISDELITEAVMKEIKTTKEQIETCPTERTELLTLYKNNLAILEKYAPKMLSREEVLEMLNTKFSDIIATKNKGQIMKNIMPELKGKADGKMINEIVLEICK